MPIHPPFPIRERIPNPADALPARPNRNLSSFPGPKAGWLFGHTRAFAQSDGEYVARMANRYGDVFKLPLLFGGGAVVMLGPEANERILARPGRDLSNHNGYAQARLFGESIVTRDFEDHAELRKLILPAFSRSALPTHLVQMNDRVESTLRDIDWRRPTTVDVFPSVKRLALGLAACSFAGIELGDRQADVNDALRAILEMVGARVPLAIPGGRFARGLRGRRFMEAFFAKLIPERRFGNGSDFFSLLCRAENDAGERLSDQEIIDNVIGAMIAGHDTTTVTIAALAFQLARHPEWQERLREDCRAAISRSSGGRLSYDAAGRLDSVEWCAKEVLRLYPPVRYVQRRVVHAFDFRDFRIPENANVLLSIVHTHRNSRYFDEPDAFRPERFDPEAPGRRVDPHAWAPFGKGPHVCLGMGFALLEIKAFFAALLTRARLTLPRDYVLRVEGLPVSMPDSPVPIRFVPLDAS